jgi:ADP-ribose pyrophosphatase
MPYDILQIEKVYEGRAFNVDHVVARLPDGKVRRFDLVQHSDSITVLPVDEEGRILFVRQYRVGAQADLLELPAGVMEAGEDPLECARRELREETGHDCRQMVKLGAAYLTPGYCTEFMHFYLAQDLFVSPLAQDEDEFLNLEAFPIEDVYAMARAGSLQDSKTLAALMLAQPYLRPVQA